MDIYCERINAIPGKLNDHQQRIHTSSTSAPTASSLAFNSSTSSFFISFNRTFGAPSTISFASLRPSPVIFRTSLMTLILALVSKPTNLRSNFVFSSAGAASSAAALPPPPAERPPPPAGAPSAETPNFSARSIVTRCNSTRSRFRILSKTASTLAWSTAAFGTRLESASASSSVVECITRRSCLLRRFNASTGIDTPNLPAREVCIRAQGVIAAALAAADTAILWAMVSVMVSSLASNGASKQPIYR
mmetsp:Transcript_36711/g.110192  ORF Transcript_36711/g.110192 Transcript_36711/m.110192 type:complete len:248 (+) Transcript_36711:242-985(+)